MKRSALSVSFIAVLSACGGGDSSEPNAFAFEDPNDAFADALRIANAGGIAGGTPFTNLAPIGSATYEGIAGVRLGGGATQRIILGTFGVEADFIGDDIAGSASDFIEVEQVGTILELVTLGPVDGTLSISNGDFGSDGGGAALSADIDGQLTDEAGARIRISTELLGGLAGAGAEYITAETRFGETSLVTLATGTSTLQDLGIELYGERQ